MHTNEQAVVLDLVKNIRGQIKITRANWQITENPELNTLEEQLAQLLLLTTDHWPLTETEKRSFSFQAFYDDRFGNLISPEVDQLRNQLHEMIHP